MLYKSAIFVSKVYKTADMQKLELSISDFCYILMVMYVYSTTVTFQIEYCIRTKVAHFEINLFSWHQIKKKKGGKEKETDSDDQEKTCSIPSYTD